MYAFSTSLSIRLKFPICSLGVMEACIYLAPVRYESRAVVNG